MTLTEYRERYGRLSFAAAGRLSETDEEFKQETGRLYESAYGTRLNRNCPDCWRDAYVALMKLTEEKFDALASRRFDLRAGALLRDVVSGDTSKLCTRKNLTDELALYHLRTNPGCIEKFTKYPEDWRVLAGLDKPKRKRSTKKKVVEEEVSDEGIST